MKILKGKKDLSSIEFCSIFCEMLLFFNSGEHFTSAIILHYQKNFLSGLKCEFNVNQKRMIDCMLCDLPFYKRNLYVLALSMLSFSTTSSFRIDFTA